MRPRIAPKDQNATVDHFEAHNGAGEFPMVVLNGYLTRSRHRDIPTTDVDHSPREFRRFVNASGSQDVQISNGLYRKTGFGRRFPIAFVNYLYASNPRIPGQMRDDYSGKHKRGIDPLSFQSLWQDGPGSQPAHPGGPGKIAAESFYNPGTS